jgi:hypothetical protein
MEQEQEEVKKKKKREGTSNLNRHSGRNRGVARRLLGGYFAADHCGFECAQAAEVGF